MACCVCVCVRPHTVVAKPLLLYLSLALRLPWRFLAARLQAKRLHKEMQAVAAAAEAARQLDLVMARRPSGPTQLKVALNKAEAAASNLSGLGSQPVPALAEVLTPLMVAARRRLDTERAADALSKAAASYRTLADLARLEAAIYNAKKVRHAATAADPQSPAPEAATRLCGMCCAALWVSGC